MPHRRPGKSGSFGGHLGELVRHFPDERAGLAPDEPKRTVDRHALKEKIDIHALLFQMAWQVEREERGS